MVKTLCLRTAPLLLHIICFFILTGCSKSNKQEATTSTISGFLPVHGGPGHQLTISGSGFDSNRSGNQVFFGSVSANVVEATDTTLDVIVPDNISTAPITVVSNGNRLVFDSPFIVSSSNAALESLSPGDILMVGLPAEFYVNGLRMDQYSGKGSDTFEIVQVHGNDLYIAGRAMGPQHVVCPAYWKNGEPTFLGNTAVEGNVRGMIIVNGAVHAVGYVKINNQMLARYWHDGIEEALPFGNPGWAEAWDIAVVNGDIHITGFGDHSARYWKNGTMLTLPKTSAGSAFYGLTVNNNDIYIAGSGQIVDPGLPRALYWKNGEPVTLTTTMNEEHAYSIAVDNGDVYVAGDKQTGNLNLTTAKYWKNGVEHILGTAGSHSRAISIDAWEGHCYIAGWENGKIKCWKDSEIIPFPYPDLTALGMDICIVK